MTSVPEAMSGYTLTGYALIPLVTLLMAISALAMPAGEGRPLTWIMGRAPSQDAARFRPLCVKD